MSGWLLERAHGMIRVLANNIWFGIISLKHIYRSGGANWISLRCLFPRCDLGFAVARCHGQQPSSDSRLIIRCTLNLITCDGDTWGSKSVEKDRMTQTSSMREKRTKPAVHNKQLILFWCLGLSSFDNDNIHISPSYLFCHQVRGDPAQNHVQRACAACCC